MNGVEILKIKNLLQKLETQNLKKQGEQYDLNSGGPRTS